VDCCIGERNHCRFWWWLLAQSVCCWTSVGIISSGHAGIRIVKTAGGMTTTTHAQGYASANALIIFSSIYVWPLALFATFMLIVHSWLALTNSTTFEITKGGEGGVDYLKGTKECDLPFSNVSEWW